MIRILFLACIGLPVFSAEASTILVLGDSISAGYGLETVQEGWVALLDHAIEPAGHRVINAGISGDTSAGGLARLPRLIEQHTPDIVIIELGGNDGLRGIAIAEMDRNLRQIISTTRKAGATPILLGMQMPPNFGKQFATRFESTYPQIAKDLSVILVKRFLEGVADVSGMMQPDAIHPNAKAQDILKGKVISALAPLLK